MPTDGNACPRLGRWIGGCRFEPRYHVDEPSRALEHVIMSQWQTTQRDRDMLERRTTYVGDVCVRCGRVVNPEQEER
jgi:hypothetical protein